MTPFLMEDFDLDCDVDYDLDLSTGGFDDHEIIAPPLREAVAVSTISFVANQPERRRRVSFDPMVKVRDVLSIDDYTLEEQDATWLDFDELDKIKEQVLNEAMLLDVGVQSKVIPTRGLECRTKKGLEAKRRNRGNAYDAVFCEIDSQEDKRLISEQMIADAYSFYSIPCAKIAQAVAKMDEIEAMKIHKEEENAKRSKRSTNNTIDLSSHFRRMRTRKREFQKRIVNLSPRNGLVSSAA